MIDRLSRVEHRLNRLEQSVRGRQFYFVSAKAGEEKVIPDEYNPDKDILFITTFESNPKKAKPKFIWRDKPFNRRVK